MLLMFIMSIVVLVITSNSYRLTESFNNLPIKNKIIYPIYWINLDKSFNRRLNIINQFTKFNITNHKRISAINGDKLHTFDDFIIPKTVYTNYEVACTLSHINSILTALSNRLERVIIMEDDICLSTINKWNHTLDDIINQAPKDWEILQLITTHAIEIKNLININKPFVKWKHEYYSAVCYIINKKGMNKIKNNLYKNNKIVLPSNISLRADDLIYLTCNTYTYTKPLFLYNITENSTIHTSHHSMHQKGLLEIMKFYNIEKLDCN